jgi:butyryl-CoA dehydrogenase
MPGNPLLSDAFVDFLLFDVLDVEQVCALPAFAGHGRDTVKPFLDACRRLARERLFPAYRPMDQEPPRFEQGRITVHPAMHDCWRGLVELGVIACSRPEAVGGQHLPLTAATLAQAYLMAGNLSAYGYAGLTTGAAHLVEAFGDEALRARFLGKLYAGEWTGTMALTEPQAGSSLADVTTRATPAADGSYRLKGAKIFISAGDHDLAENVVHLVLARIDGAPAGTKGISLFAVPKRREGPGGLVDNDVQVTGLIHKIGWRGLPSLALAFGERDDCHGWLVGPAHQGLKCMFQMMNEARLMVGLNAAATASVAFHEALAYARERKQGRPLGVADATTPQVPLVEHADVRRMLLQQKAIVEGALGLLGFTARFADLAQHAPDADERARCQLLLDLLTPIAKSFPAERGFEANALAVQVHGGYGYSSEYLPEAFLRDQKLNSIHEGTTGIQGLDLLGRKVVAKGGAALMAFAGEVQEALELPGDVGFPTAPLADALEALVTTTSTLGARGAEGDVQGMLAHSTDFLELASLVAVGWVWLTLAKRSLAKEDDLGQGLRAAAQHWFERELPRVPALARLCLEARSSYVTMQADWFGPA